MNYEELSVAQLRELAKEKDIKKVSALKKQELVDALTAAEAAEKKNETAAAVKAEEKKAPIERKPEKKNVEPEKKNVEPEKKSEDDKNAEAKRQALQELKKATEMRDARRSQPARPVQNAGRPAPSQPANRPAPSQNQQAANRPVSSQTQQPANRPSQPRPNNAQPGVKVIYNNTQANVQTNAQTNNQAKSAAAESETEVNPRSFLSPEAEMLDSGELKEGIFELCSDGYGFIRCDNFLPGENDVYVSPAQIRKFNLKTGDIIAGNTKIKSQGEKYAALLYVKTVNGRHPSEAQKRPRFEDLTPVFPHDRIHLETPGCSPAMRIVDILSPIGKGQRGMIVSQPKAGKTTLLKQIAKAITVNHPAIHLIILLVDERPEEVTDMKESIGGGNVEVIYSTFDELPENHKRVSEMVIERAKRLVEHKQDVVILLDSITRLARAYNLTCASSGRTLSGGLDPAALHMPKKFFGAARCMREGGSLTILSTALVDTGSRMDDVVFEEFKGTGNMELVLDRNLSEKRIFPAIDLPKSSTRRDDLLLTTAEQECNEILRHAFNSSKSDSAVEKIINMFSSTKNNNEFCEIVKKTKLL